MVLISWPIWKPRVSSFPLIYIYVTQVLTSYVLFLNLPKEGHSFYLSLACGYHQLPYDIIRTATPRISHLIFYGPHKHSVSVAYLWENMVNVLVFS